MTGGSSYVITLPKEWITTFSIKKNDIVGVEIQQDGSLIVFPRSDVEKVQKLKEIDVSEIDDPTFLFRYLIGAYEAGFSSIIIKSEKRLPLFVRPIIREFTQMTIGQEVIEETERSITLKDLLNPAEMPFMSTIRRMYIIAKTMHENTQNALINKDVEIIDTVISGDNDVDRLNWLIGRQYSIILRDPALAKKMDISPEIASHYFLVSRLIERIGDHYVRMAENIGNLIHEKIDDRTYKRFVDVITPASDLALEIFDKSIKSYIKKDIKSANKTIESIKGLTTRCEKIRDLTMKQKGIVALSMGYIEESIRRIGEYSGDLSEYVINYLIRE
jgi:phosphate uptake regulator